MQDSKTLWLCHMLVGITTGPRIWDPQWFERSISQTMHTLTEDTSQDYGGHNALQPSIYQQRPTPILESINEPCQLFREHLTTSPRADTGRGHSCAEGISEPFCPLRKHSAIGP